jgi:methyl-accepting chemotaxis protein
MSIARKITAGYVLALLIIIVFGGLAYWSTSRLVDNNVKVENNHEILADLQSLLRLLVDIETGERGYLLTHDETFLEPYQAALLELGQVQDQLEQRMAANDNQRSLLAELRPQVGEFLDFAQAAIDARKAASDDATDAQWQATLAEIKRGKGKELMDQVRLTIDKLSEQQNSLLRAGSTRAEASAALTRRIVLVGTPLVALLVSLVGFFAIRSVTLPVRDAVQRLSAASAEILASTTEQAAGAQQQAASVTQTVVTVDEVTKTANQAAEHAKAVAESARRVDEVGRAGRKSIEDAIASMDTLREQVEAVAENILELAERAQAIGEIIATVHEIAERTNLLALNAAIEASRAGEHGRGFAVVAGEVKALAEQSKKATGQVKQILGQIQQATNTAVLSTEQGTKAVAEAAAVVAHADETIRALAEMLTASARAAAQIVASVGQQATGTSQINESMKSIELATRQSLAATRQAEQAARDLNLLGQGLRAMVEGNGDARALADVKVGGRR